MKVLSMLTCGKPRAKRPSPVKVTRGTTARGLRNLSYYIKGRSSIKQTKTTNIDTFKHKRRSYA